MDALAGVELCGCPSLHELDNPRLKAVGVTGKLEALRFARTPRNS